MIADVIVVAASPLGVRNSMRIPFDLALQAGGQELQAYRPKRQYIYAYLHGSFAPAVYLEGNSAALQ